MSEARLFVISAPSGCGKGTILKEVFKDIDVYYSVSCTTRKPREGEADGKDYFFVDKRKFNKLIKEDGFLEYAEFVENKYGTPKAPVLENLAAGRDVILEIETQGAFQVKEKMPESVLIFILAPSVSEIRRRLFKRATESEDVIEGRVSKAAGEIQKAFKYDYVIMNDELEKAVEDFKTVYNSARNGDGSADRFRADNEDTVNMINEVLENA
ncbi:MAG: guanylate kinase [Ruminococcus sp.]|nr:guanylate kinase [Ruminococcus sp.]